MAEEKRIGADHERIGPLSDERGKGIIDIAL